MSRSVEAVITRLKGMIDRNGPHHLSDKPYQVYEELIESGKADRKTAGAILLFLVNGMMDELDCDKPYLFEHYTLDLSCTSTKKLKICMKSRDFLPNIDTMGFTLSVWLGYNIP